MYALLPILLLFVPLTFRYRRGKELSSDVDIVITRQGSDEKDIDHICQYLVSQLQQAGKSSIHRERTMLIMCCWVSA
jgi:hypothetical protein